MPLAGATFKQMFNRFANGIADAQGAAEEAGVRGVTDFVRFADLIGIAARGCLDS